MSTTRRVGPWRAVWAGWRVFVPVIVVDAVLQALLVIADPVPTMDLGFVALTLGSLVAAVLAVWLTVGAASAAVDGKLPALRHRPAVLSWALVAVVLATVVSLIEPLAVPAVLVIVAFVLPSAARGESAAAGFRAVRHAPWRYLLAVLSVLLVSVLSWVIALVLGFFVTGVVGVVVTWLWFGVAATVLLCLWCAAFRDATDRAAGVR